MVFFEQVPLGIFSTERTGGQQGAMPVRHSALS